MPHEHEQPSKRWLITWSSGTNEVERNLIVGSVSLPFSMEIEPKKVNYNDDNNQDQPTLVSPRILLSLKETLMQWNIHIGRLNGWMDGWVDA